MRKGWEYKKLGDLCDIYQPKTLATEQLVVDGKYYVYGANGIIGRYNDYNHEQSEILLTCRGATCGTINISQPYSWINGNAMVIHRKSEDLSFDFLKYLMLSLDYSLIITGAAQPQITRQKIAPIIVKFPSLSVQQSIVSELDKINELIRLKKEQLKDYDNLAQSIFYEMFGDPVVNEKGWEVKRITDLCVEISAGGDASKHEIKKTKDEIFSVPVYSNGIDEDGLYGYSNHATINQPAITLAARGTIGAAFIRTEPYIPIIRLVSVIPDLSKISLTYLFYILKQTEWDRTGGTIPQLPVPKVKQLTLPLPPLPLQQAFAQRIELIEQQKAEIQSTIADLETLLASRMQYWFD